MKITVHIFILLEFSSWGHSEFFTSVEHMKVLVKTQERTIKILERYIKKETERTNIIEKHLTRFKSQHEIAKKDINLYLGNPINALTLIKRLAQDLPFVEIKIKSPTAFRLLSNLKYPTRKDCAGAVKAVMRLQMTYQLNVTQLANGELTASFTEDRTVHKDVFTPLTASDCFEIGLGFYNDTEYKHGVTWFKVAHERFLLEESEDHDLQEADIINQIYTGYLKLEESEDHDLQEADIINQIYTGYLKLADTENMITWLKKLITVDSKNLQAPNWHELVKTYEERFAEEEKMRNEGWWTEVPWTYNEHLQAEERLAEEKRHRLTHAQRDQKVFEVYCGVDEVFTVPIEIRKRLKCFYQSGPHPYLRLARVKVEQLYTNPVILLFRDVITDHEIEELKTIASPRMKNPIKPGTIHYHSADVVISKSDWVTVNESQVVKTLQRRIATITGLNEGQESLQVANYGISGHRFPHYDFLGINFNDTTLFPEGGDRLATAFFYMSDITQGGAMVFPHLGVKVYPQKGSALFWYNLHRSGEGDISTKHVECPVLVGNKWAAVLWKSQVEQELRRPCSKQHQQLCDLHPFHYPLPPMMHEQICIDRSEYII